jgi:hypothetical protein
LGKATLTYLEAIPRLSEIPRPLGHREIPPTRERQDQLKEALRIMQEPVPVDGEVEQLALWT